MKVLEMMAQNAIWSNVSQREKASKLELWIRRSAVRVHPAVPI
jgi:hypothetical protein